MNDLCNSNQKKIVRIAMGEWIFKKGRTQLNDGFLFKGYKNLIIGLFLNKKNYLYKISVILLSLILNQSRIDLLLNQSK